MHSLNSFKSRLRYTDYRKFNYLTQITLRNSLGERKQPVRE